MGVAFVAHCLLNQNSKVLDGAHCAGVYSPVVDVLRERGWRIEQMPCPELAFAGLNRFWAVREQYDTAAFRRHCQRLATAVAGAIAARVQQGEEIVLVGACYGNAGPGQLDGLAVLAAAGWGVMQLPDDGYPAEVARPLLAEVAEQVEEFSRRGYGFILVGERDGLAGALAQVGVAVPDRIVPA